MEKMSDYSRKQRRSNKVMNTIRALAVGSLAFFGYQALDIDASTNVKKRATLSQPVQSEFSMTYEAMEKQTPEHDGDKFLIHLADGATLDDVDLFNLGYGELREHTYKLTDMPNTPGETFDDIYVINPPTFNPNGLDDSELESIVEAFKEDIAFDPELTDVDYNIVLKHMMVEENGDGQENQTLGKECYSRDTLCSKMYGMDLLNGKGAHEFLEGQTPKKKAKVYVVDTGVNTHKDLPISSEDAVEDFHMHGSHCAGSVAAVSNNKEGVFSLAPNADFVELHAKRVLDRNGRGSLETISQGIYEAVKEGADVISMSLGGSYFPGTDGALHKAVKLAYKKGVITIVAGGNENRHVKKVVPARYNEVITVAAVDHRMKRANFSNFGTDIAGPGVNIMSTDNKGGYISASGTSMATPHIAGLAGLARALNPDLTQEQFYQATLKSAKQPKHEKKKPTKHLPDARATLEAVVDLRKTSYTYEDNMRDAGLDATFFAPLNHGEVLDAGAVEYGPQPELQVIPTVHLKYLPETDMWKITQE